jgi:signal transduction histidine kinase
VRSRLFLVDAVVGLVAAIISVGVLASSSPVGADVRAADTGAYVLVVVYSGSVLARRRAPVAAVAVGLAAGLVYAAAGYPVALTPVALMSVYTAAGVLPRRPARVLLAVAVVVGSVGATLAPGPTDTSVPTLIGGAWLLGRYVGSKRAYTAELERKNEQLELAQRELADRAVTEERVRIARELHDVVAHTMSVVAVHAGTGRMVADSDPAAAKAALGTIETATRSALLEMRRLLGVLRSSDGVPPPELAPAPGLADVDALVARRGEVGGHGRRPGRGAARRRAAGRRPDGVPDRAGGADQRDQACWPRPRVRRRPLRRRRRRGRGQ